LKVEPRLGECVGSATGIGGHRHRRRRSQSFVHESVHARGSIAIRILGVKLGKRRGRGGAGDPMSLPANWLNGMAPESRERHGN
jgi:hypothetical protein